MRVYPESHGAQELILRTIPDATEMDSDDFKQLVLHHLAPGLGCVIAFIMFFSPFKAVQQIKRQKHLGDFNPLPLVAIIANCLAWLVYGSVKVDIYVIMANLPGLWMGLYMTITAYGFADAQLRDLLMRVLLAFAVFISSGSVYMALFIPDQITRITAAGYQAVFILLVYYAAPLSALAEVLRSRSSASLYWPLSFMSCVNGSLWVAYGLAVGDRFIWAPNAVGAFFGVVQLLLICTLPSKASSTARRAAAAAAVEEDAMRAPLRVPTNNDS